MDNEWLSLWNWQPLVSFLPFTILLFVFFFISATPDFEPKSKKYNGREFKKYYFLSAIKEN